MNREDSASSREPDPGPPRVRDVEADEVGAFYAHTCRQLIGLLTALGGNRADAEEVAQDSYIRLLENWSKVRDYDDPQAWLRTVAIRMLISRYRRRKVAALGLRKLASERRVTSDSSDDRLVVAAALERLPIGHRAVVLLHHLYDQPVDEVARQLNVPVGTVKSRLSRARSALAPVLGDEERSIR